MIIQSGLSIIHSAQQSLNSAASKLVKDPTDPQQLVTLKTSVIDAEVGAKVIKAGTELTDTLLDVLA